MSGRRLGAGCLALAALALPSLGHADARVSLDAETLRAAPGEEIRVRYAVSIRNEPAARVAALNFGNLEVLSDPSPPQAPDMAFGGFFGGGGTFAMSMETAQDYVVRAARPGRYSITGARVIDARTGRPIAQHAPLVLEITGAPGAAPPGSEPTATASGEAPRDPDAPPVGELTGARFDPTAFVRMAPDVARPYLGQQVTLRAWLYTASSQVNCEVSTEPALPGFWSEALVPPGRECASRWFSQQIGDGYMSVGLLRKLALFPSQTGTLTIGPPAVAVELVSGGIFRSLRRVELRGVPVTVEVREPPAAGRPAGYVPGTIGPVTLAAEVDRTELAVGETAVFTLRARSEGSLASATVAAPTHVDGVRVRAAGARTSHDLSTGRVVTTLVTEILAVPERPGRFDLGEVELPYWDPIAERYGVARAALPTVHATGAALRDERNHATPETETELAPLRARPALRPASSAFVRGRTAPIVIAAPPLLLALGLAAKLLGRRWSRRRSMEASERARDPDALLAQAHAALGTDPAAAVSFAARALDRAVAQARDEIDGGLAALPGATRSKLETARARLDALRFAGGAGSDRDAARDAVDAVEQAIEAVEAAL